MNHGHEASVAGIILDLQSHDNNNNTANNQEDGVNASCHVKFTNVERRERNS